MADFSNFELGDNVAEFADGLLPEMADVFEVPLSPTPTVEELGQLVGVIGRSKVLRENVPRVQEVLGTAADGLTIAADWLERSGVQSALERSLWTPSSRVPWATGRVVIMGAVANWQDRTATLLESKASSRTTVRGMVDILTGNRVMDTATEVSNPNVVRFVGDHDRFPTEDDYATTYIRPFLRFGGYSDEQVLQFHSQNGDEIIQQYLETNPGVLDTEMIVARVANAGIQLACQVRKAARRLNPDFDFDKNNPQLFVVTDSLPIARTQKELQDALHFQNPFSGIRQIALTGKLLVEALQD